MSLPAWTRENLPLWLEGDPDRRLARTVRDDVVHEPKRPKRVRTVGHTPGRYDDGSVDVTLPFD